MNGRHVFLSPHRDDAILSCGGLLAMLARGQRRALIVNVFGGAEAPATLSDYSIELLANLDATSFPDAVALRSAEDQRACAIVGAKRDELPFVPAPIRAPEYASWDAIVGEIPACDAGLHERIARGTRRPQPPNSGIGRFRTAGHRSSRRSSNRAPGRARAGGSRTLRCVLRRLPLLRQSRGSRRIRFSRRLRTALHLGRQVCRHEVRGDPLLPIASSPTLPGRHLHRARRKREAARTRRHGRAVLGAPGKRRAAGDRGGPGGYGSAVSRASVCAMRVERSPGCAAR